MYVKLEDSCLENLFGAPMHFAEFYFMYARLCHYIQNFGSLKINGVRALRLAAPFATKLFRIGSLYHLSFVNDHSRICQGCKHCFLIFMHE